AGPAPAIGIHRALALLGALVMTLGAGGLLLQPGAAPPVDASQSLTSAESLRGLSGAGPAAPPARLVPGPGGSGGEAAASVLGQVPSGGAWTETGPMPPARYEHTAVWDAAGGRMLVFGGFKENVPQLLDDLWSYQAGSNGW